jgi:hypothetical protein
MNEWGKLISSTHLSYQYCPCDKVETAISAKSSNEFKFVNEAVCMCVCMCVTQSLNSSENSKFKNTIFPRHNP